MSLGTQKCIAAQCLLFHRSSCLEEDITYTPDVQYSSYTLLTNNTNVPFKQLFIFLTSYSVFLMYLTLCIYSLQNKRK